MRKRKGKARELTPGLDVPLERAPVVHEGDPYEPPFDDHAILADALGPRLWLRAHGACILMRPRPAVTLCGASVTDSRDFYSRPLVFAKLEIWTRQDVLDELLIAMRALRAAGVCQACAAVVDDKACPGIRFTWRPEAMVQRPHAHISERWDEALCENLAERAGRGAKWTQVRGWEIPLIRDSKLPEGQIRVKRADLKTGTIYFVNHNVPPDLEGAY